MPAVVQVEDELISDEMKYIYYNRHVRTFRYTVIKKKVFERRTAINKNKIRKYFLAPHKANQLL